MTNHSYSHSERGLSVSTLVELLRWRSVDQSAKRAYTFLKDGETEEAHLTYSELDRQARLIGSQLQSFVSPGERALLLYPPGLQYIAAFFGCLYAGVIAIPAYPPRLNRHQLRLRAVVADAEASVVLTTAPIKTKARKEISQLPELSALRWISTDDMNDESDRKWQDPDIGSNTTAFLQYTSGSTASPKGVVVSHRNLLHNGRMIQKAYALSGETVIVSWLPLYHDMGLIGNMIQALYLGARCVLMSPTAFLQRPYRWLKAITRYKGSFSGGPNFAYDLCVDKITPEQRAELDLSSWGTAFNGAEPIRPQTLQRFALAFGSCGFDPKASCPVYGLAEGTLFVSGKLSTGEPLVQPFEVAALEQRRAVAVSEVSAGARRLVSCGRTLLNQKTIIVDPQSLTRCLPERIGEIWVAGESITQGYWNKPEETERTFRAFLRDTGEGPFLRTGDLGFIEGNELFITGRYKDLIIIRGRNHYPQDIELTVEQSHPALKPGSGAAFTVEVDNEERLVIVHEIERRNLRQKNDEIIRAIRQAVVEEHELEVYAIVLIKTRTIQKTSSGKIQRHLCRKNFLSRSLEIVEESISNADLINPCGLESESRSTNTSRSSETSGRGDLIRNWLISRIAGHLKVPLERIDARVSFSRLGIDSIGAVRISGDLEAWMGRSLSPTIIYEYPNIDALATHLAGEPSISSPAYGGEELPMDQSEPLAIIGIGCRVPGARGPRDLWRLLSDGVDAITEVPPERWNANAFYAKEPGEPGKANTRWGGFLEGIDLFDPHFWGISPREATRIDPQQRLVLEVAWEALEDAGQVVEHLAGARVGVFMGVSANEYGRLQFSDPALIDAYAGTGNALSIAANRLSYLLDLRGPSLAIDTACSSSLVAVHLACQSLKSGESTLAIAGGVNLILTPALTINFAKAGVMAPDGRCKAFDERANGYVRSEGAGVVILKRLSAALIDGDKVYAVILGTAVNQDGRTNGLMAPSRQAQEALLEEAYGNAGVSPGEVQYVETHGTGTFLGDPIEAKALGAVLSRGRRPGSKCAIGSVKTNIGHLEAAAGVVGLIKVALLLKHRAIPPSLHFCAPNPHIPFDILPLQVQQTFSPWPDNSGRALAGVSSFSFGGTNAHIVLTDADQFLSVDPQTTEPEFSRTRLLTLSAHNMKCLYARAQSYYECLSTDEYGGEGALDDLCFTANTRQSRHDYRLALFGDSREELINCLKSFLARDPHPSVVSGRILPERQPKLVFVFPGQGCQWFGMGRDLFAQEPLFRETIELCDRAMRKYVDWSLLEEFQAGQERNRFGEIEIVQPVIFAIQVALAALWRSWGIEPHAVVGQSMGEVAAAYVSGCLSLDDAARIICLRSRSLKRMRGLGAMALVELPIKQAELALKGYENQLSIAISNSPTSTVMAGDPSALGKLIEELGQKDIFCRMIKVDVASHSPQMEPLRDEILQALEGLRPQPSSIPIYSTVTGAISDGRQFDASYWMRNLREPVLLSEAIQQLVESGHTLSLELSPHPILLNAIKQVLQHLNREGEALPSMARHEEGRAGMLKSLGGLYVRGCSINWNKFYSVRGKCVSLPSYPWQYERCWFEDEMGGVASGWVSKNWNQPNNANQPPLIQRHFKSVFPADAHYCEVELDRKRFVYLNDYRIQGAVVLPSAAYIEMTMAAASKAFGAVPRVLSELEFQEPLFLPDRGARTLQIILAAGNKTASDFRIYSRPGGIESPSEQWLLHATGKVLFETSVH